MENHTSSSPFIFLIENLDIPFPPTHTETFFEVDSENENGEINSISLKFE